MNDLPFDARITSHGLFEQPLAAPDELTDVELAAVRAGVSLDWSYLTKEPK